MRLAEIRTYPIKSLLGESVQTATIERRGLAGDRLWAVRDHDGKLGSGKDSRRFRRMPGLLSLRGHSGERVPVVELPEGRHYDADDPAGHAAVSEFLNRTVTISRETDVVHHDDGPVSIVSTGALERLHAIMGEPVDARRFRANLLVDGAGAGFVEDTWIGRTLAIGPDVVLVPQKRLTRCVMIDMAQDGLGLPDDGRLLKTLSRHNEMTFGVWATVERPGTISVGDRCVLADVP
ncbi:MAG: MOSC domain-containing protein [Micromonosporaceae bacterium]